MFDINNFDIFVEALKNSPDILYSILRSLGYTVCVEEYDFSFDVPVYEYKPVQKSRQVEKPSFCGFFGVSLVTEYYTENEKVFVRYDTKTEKRKRYVLKKIEGDKS